MYPTIHCTHTVLFTFNCFSGITVNLKYSCLLYCTTYSPTLLYCTVYGTVYTFLCAQLSTVIPLYKFAVYFVGKEMKAVK